MLPVAADKSDEAATLAAARRLVAAARSGGDFKALVQQEVKAGRATGGDLGIVLVTDMRAEVRDAIAKLKPGEISDPFESPAGVHIVQVIERIPPTVRPFKEVEDELREQRTRRPLPGAPRRAWSPSSRSATRSRPTPS